MMNAYVLRYRIFDTDSTPNLDVFPRSESMFVYAETHDEAQREIVDRLYQGILKNYSRKEDAPDRFRIVFDKEPFMDRPVVWLDEYQTWFWDDEPLEHQIQDFLAYRANCTSSAN